MTKNVIIYTRVSTDEQADRGNSLTNQEMVITQYCKIKGYNILKHFKEDYSAKTFNRPEWIELLKYVNSNKKLVDSILILRWDRFSRNQKEATNQIDNLNKMGIKVESIEQPLDLDIPESQLLLNIYLTIPEIENKKNSIRTIECSRAARIAGCWTGTAPVGYNNCRDSNNKSTLIRNEKAELVLEAFQEVANNQKSVDKIRKEFSKKGLRLSKQSFLDMLRNIAYTGRIVVKAFKKEDAKTVDGLHEAIISDGLFQTVKNVLAGKKNVHQKSRKEDENFPLRGHLLCPLCNGSLTGGKSKGSTKYYNYYKCQQNCIPNIRAEEANDQFVNFLATLNISYEVSVLYQQVIEDVFKTNEGDNRIKAQSISKKIEDINAGLEKANEKYFVSGVIDDDTYKTAIKQLNKTKADLNCELSELQIKDDILLKYTRFAFPFLNNLDMYYQSSTLHTRKFIVSSIFPEKLYYSEKSYRTTKLNEVLALICNTGNPFQTKENRKALKNQGLSTMAPPSGLEPETL
ncbi:MAG TPA: recombinase family protein [Ferruginibacter sp.]|nr:recombinase family protein [Ferruginibacter sp.]